MVNIIDHMTGIVVGILSAIGFLIGFIAWFIRLESKVLYLEKDQENHKKDGGAQIKSLSDKLDSFQITLNQVLQGVARLEGQSKKGD